MPAQTVTWDSTDKSSAFTLTERNLTITSSASNTNRGHIARANLGRSAGKYYFEAYINRIDYAGGIGVATKSVPLNTDNRNNVNMRIFPLKNNSFQAGDTAGISIDIDNDMLKLYKNGEDLGISFTDLKLLGELYPVVMCFTNVNDSMSLTVNFGASEYNYEIPKGYFSYDGSQYGSYNKILFSSENKIHSISPPIYATETATPQMISDISPNGRAFASSVRSSSEAAWKAFDRTESYYSAVNTVGRVGYLGYEFVNPIAIGKYAVRNRASAADTPPKNWTFEGSNDGSSWTILDSRIDQIWGNISEDKDYFVAPDKINNYKMYRLNWTSNNGSITTCINELKMYEVSLTLVSLSDQSEKSFINYGVELPVNIAQLDGIKSVESNSNTQESGKTFEHTVDLSKRRVDKILLQ